MYLYVKKIKVSSFTFMAKIFIYFYLISDFQRGYIKSIFLDLNKFQVKDLNHLSAPLSVQMRNFIGLGEFSFYFWVDSSRLTLLDYHFIPTALKYRISHAIMDTVIKNNKYKNMVTVKLNINIKESL